MRAALFRLYYSMVLYNRQYEDEKIYQNFERSPQGGRFLFEKIKFSIVFFGDM